MLKLRLLTRGVAGSQKKTKKRWICPLFHHQRESQRGVQQRNEGRREIFLLSPSSMVRHRRDHAYENQGALVCGPHLVVEEPLENNARKGCGKMVKCPNCCWNFFLASTTRSASQKFVKNKCNP